MLGRYWRVYVIVAILCLLAGGNIGFLVLGFKRQEAVSQEVQSPAPQTPQATHDPDALLTCIKGASGDGNVTVVLGGAEYIPGEYGVEFPLFLRNGVLRDLLGHVVTDLEKDSLRGRPGQEVYVIRLTVENHHDVPIADLAGAIRFIKSAVARDQKCVLIVYFS